VVVDESSHAWLAREEEWSAITCEQKISADAARPAIAAAAADVLLTNCLRVEPTQHPVHLDMLDAPSDDNASRSTTHANI
jgi:hypothetical protein